MSHSAQQNRQVILAARPRGFPVEADFQLVESMVPEPDDGQVVVQAAYLSVDPYMRGRMNDAASYAKPVEIGQVMVGESVGKVIRSRNQRFPEGQHVAGMFGWQEYGVSSGAGLRKVDPAVAPLTTALHVLGMPGLTAYFGLLEVCQPTANETVVVSGAAGAVGSVVGQLARSAGCHVVGIAGSDDKVRYITQELGYDHGLNYKTSDDLREDLAKLCPRGVDVYFDNVGGPVTDAVFPLLNVAARVGICGQISQYNAREIPQGPRLLGHLIVKRATVRGFLVLDFVEKYHAARSRLTELYREGTLNCRERITDGIENAPRAFMEMMQGANIGKQLVRLCPE